MTTMITEQYLEVRRWRLHDTASGQHVQFKGQLLGAASSQRPEHNHDGERAPGGGPPCHACRWFEVRIIVTTEEEYVVSYEGFTTFDFNPNTGKPETHRATVHRTRSPHTVIEVLTQVRNNEMFIPRTSRLALSEAAGRDDGIERAWIDRVVA